MVKIKGLYKSFVGKDVLRDLNLELNDGEITALVGANGAGKSTLIRIISGILRQDKGEVFIDKGTSIGVMLGGDVMLYNNLTGYEIIKFFGKIQGLSLSKINEKIDEMDSVLKLKPFLDKRSFTFSRGMRQKVAFVVSIINDPNVLLLNEPSTGLDLESSNDVIKFIKYLKTRNKTILIATHNIFEICDLSDKIAFLKGGKVESVFLTEDFFAGCPKGEQNKLLVSYMRENTI